MTSICNSSASPSASTRADLTKGGWHDIRLPGAGDLGQHQRLSGRLPVVRGPGMAVVISGAPGAGKTTLGALLAELMSLPHLNKDITMRALRRSRVPTEIANKWAFEVVYGTAQRWLSTGVSVVMDMTMYPDYSVAEVQSLLPFGFVINVHCRAANAVERWEDKMRQHNGERAEAEIERLRWVYDVAIEPLDFGCPRLEVDTTDGYEPGINELITAIEHLHTQYLQTMP